MMFPERKHDSNNFEGLQEKIPDLSRKNWNQGTKLPTYHEKTLGSMYMQICILHINLLSHFGP